MRPDFLCLSKGLTGGYLPLSCVLTTERSTQAFYDDDVARGFLHSHSYTGNPLACRAALAALLDLSSEERRPGDQRAKQSVSYREGPLASRTIRAYATSVTPG